MLSASFSHGRITSMTKRGSKSTPRFIKLSFSAFLSAYSSGNVFSIMLFNVTLIAHVLGLMKRTVRHNGHLLYRSIDWKRHARQKECPQGVVIGSNNSFKHRVQSKSSLRCGLPWILLPSVALMDFSKFRRELLEGFI